MEQSFKWFHPDTEKEENNGFNESLRMEKLRKSIWILCYV